MEARAPLAAECGVQPEDIARNYRPDFTKRLLPAITPELLEATEIMKAFLCARGYLPRDFTLTQWLNPEPLREALRREGSGEVPTVQAAQAG